MAKQPKQKSLPRDDSSAVPVRSVLTLNSGSSSIKFALFQTGQQLERLLTGKIERIGLADAMLTIKDSAGKKDSRPINAADHRAAGEFVVRWLKQQPGLPPISGVGHRVVHGGPRFTQPQIVTSDLLAELDRLSPYDPEHLPSGIHLMKLFHQRLAGLP